MECIFSSNKTVLIKFVLILSVIFYTTNEFSARFVQFAASENPFRNYFIFLVIWVISIYLALAVSLIDSSVTKAIYAFMASISIFVSVSYKTITNSPLSYGDMCTLWIAREDYKSAIFNYWQSSIFAFFVAFLLFIAILYPVHLHQKKYLAIKWAKYGFIIPIVIIALMISQKGGAAAIGLPEIFKPAAMFSHLIYFEANNDFDKYRKFVEITPKQSTSTLPHLVIIIDESVRGDFLSINNTTIGTTPFLESVSDHTANFGYATTTHECSHYANANLRYGTHSTDLKNSLLTNPSIWEYAKKAGYHTTYLDAQRRHGQLQNLMSLRERKSIDDFIQFNDVDAVERAEPFIQKDQRAASLLNTILSRDSPQLVLLNKEGVHPPYEGKYPESATKFTPTMSLAESISPELSREKLINSYRNAITWSVDKFFEKLLLKDSSWLKRTILVYTGDHGQNLLDKGTATHCSGSSDPPKTIALVPLFIITEQFDFKSAFQNAAKMNIHKVSHFNLFPTLLWVMGYSENDYHRFYDPPLTDKLDGLRFWFSGDILTNLEHKHFY